MHRSIVNIMTLPDELIITIWNKLNKIDVLYSFLNVNKRFNKLVRDKIYTCSIELIKINGEEEKDNCSLSDQILDRFCLDILPQIHHTVEELILEPLSMERILYASDYPRLRKLTLIDLTQESALRVFSDESHFANIFKKQITHLVILVDDSESRSNIGLRANIFARVSALFTNLTDLDFRQNCELLDPIWTSDYLAINNCFSATIVNLRIDMYTFSDCRPLLDGRLRQLRTLIVRTNIIHNSRLPFTITDLLYLKCFSLTSHTRTNAYDSRVVPLLRRMINLEELTLHLTVEHRSTFIDGFCLKNEILDHMPQIQTFNFNIITCSNVNIDVNSQLSNDIRSTFLNGKFRQVDFYFDQNPDGTARSHIYSLPYKFNVMCSIGRNFPGGLFPSVRLVSAEDFCFPFGCKFYARIAHSFPFLFNLSICDVKQRNYKTLREATQNNQISSVIVFPHLTHLSIFIGNMDTAEQFLVDTNTVLPRLTDLTIPYSFIQQITENFTREATRRNCAHIKRLTFYQQSLVHCKDFYLYFPCYK